MKTLDAIQNIAIIRRNGLGDVLCSIPLVLRCKELMPNAKVTLFLEESGFLLAPYLQGPDEIALIPPSRNKYFGIAKLGWQRRSESFDLAISAKTSPMKLMNVSLFALRAKERAAYVEGKWYDRFVNRAKIFEKDALIHQALQAIQLIDPEMSELPQRLHPKLRSVRKEKLFEKKTLFISVSNNRAGSMLDLERIASLLNKLASIQNFAVAISCLSKDIDKAERLSSLFQMQHSVFVTEQFSQFLTLLNSADAIFTGDGGIVHLAAALEKPSLCLFGGTKVEQWGPLSNQAIVLSHAGHIMQLPEENILEKLKQLLELVEK